jgi:hypothetical protein
MALRECPHDFDKILCVARASDADDELPCLASSEPFADSAGVARLRQGQPCVLYEHLAGGGELHLATAAIEELHAQLVLELSDLLTQRWLPHVQARRGTPEVQCLGDGDHIPKVPEFHGWVTRSSESATDIELISQRLDFDMPSILHILRALLNPHAERVTLHGGSE